MDDENVTGRRIIKVLLAVIIVVLVALAAVVTFMRFKNTSAVEPKPVEAAIAETDEETEAVIAEPEVEETAELTEIPEASEETVDSLPVEIDGSESAAIAELQEVIVEALPELDEEHSFYEKLAMGKNVSILIMGDTCAEGTGASAIGESEDGRDHRWFVQLSDYLSENYLNGQKPHVVSLASESASVLQDTLDLKNSTDDTSYDLILLTYGLNEDYMKSGMYFEALIMSLRDRYPNASFITTLEPCQHYVTTSMDYMRGISYDYGIPVIDLYGYYYSSSISIGFEHYLKHFDVHQTYPSDQGQDEWFELLKTEIDANVEGRTGRIKDRRAIDPMAPMLAKMQYMAVDDARVTRIDDTSFSVDVNADGLAYMVHKDNIGEGDVKVIADDILYQFRKPNGIKLNSGDYLSSIHSELVSHNSFTITFSGKEYADGLRGFYFCYPEE